ncbi:glycosyltransferase [Mangrovicella endophytica]|uniref:glycosyltransferase n=1 Tax=Mangrovicella endophytica TaxID=2066697 RepID=UPI000C9DED48|nr:glycosyltransferase [Mangrovicella endophytica]
MTLPPRSGKIAFVVTEDWFFVSHFLPMARAAVEMGLQAVVITRVRAHADAIRATGARVIPLEAERRDIRPTSIIPTVRRLTEILEAERPDIVHCIALRSILVGGAAAARAGIRRRVFALTGLGYLGARRDLAGHAARGVIAAALRGPLSSARTRYLFENPNDAGFLGLDPGSPRVTIVGGAGVDPSALPPLPLPPVSTLRIAVVARMLWSKGIDTAVEAVMRARAAGADVELSLFGAPDPSNPKAVPEAQLRAWSEHGSIVWRGFAGDIAAVWREHHVACLASRGGEGLPRTLLEAAACGRAILTTDVPGCRDFVRDGLDGIIVPPGNSDALAAAMQRLAGDRALCEAMGRSGRERILAGYTERHVMDAVAALYRDMLQD